MLISLSTTYPNEPNQDGEWDDEDDGKPSNQKSSEMAFLSDLLGPGGVEDLMNDDMDLFNSPEDPELKDDPVWSMDMKVSGRRQFFSAQLERRWFLTFVSAIPNHLLVSVISFGLLP